jgi:hypothetical protein
LIGFLGLEPFLKLIIFEQSPLLNVLIYGVFLHFAPVTLLLKNSIKARFFVYFFEEKIDETRRA